MLWSLPTNIIDWVEFSANCTVIIGGIVGLLLGKKIYNKINVNFNLSSYLILDYKNPVVDFSCNNGSIYIEKLIASNKADKNIGRNLNN